MQNKWEKLINLFKERNSRINLSAIRDEESIKIKHIDDSLIILSDEFLLKFPQIRNLLQKKWLKICDVGTGWGFPLLPLAISLPNAKFLGIEARNKKVKAVNDIIKRLWLKNAKVIWSRAEQEKKQCDIVTARAVAYITKLLPWVSHLVKKWGYLLLYKLVSDEEYEDLKNIIKKYWFKLDWFFDYKLFDKDILRRIYVLKKEK